MYINTGEIYIGYTKINPDFAGYIDTGQVYSGYIENKSGLRWVYFIWTRLARDIIVTRPSFVGYYKPRLDIKIT